MSFTQNKKTFSLLMKAILMIEQYFKCLKAICNIPIELFQSIIIEFSENSDFSKK